MSARLQILLTLLFAFFWSGVANAEGAQQKRLGLILFGGFSFTSHSSTNAGSLGGVTGMAFGFGVDYKLTKEISLELDMLDVWKSYESRTPTTVTQYNLSFLEFPLLLRYNPAPWFALKAGPYLAGFIMQAERQTAGTADSIKGDFKNDFGMTAGAWMGFMPTGSMSLGMDIRYDFGLTNVLNDRNPSRSIATRTLMTMFTITFNIK